MTFVEIIQLVCIALTFIIGTAIPFVIALVNYVKKYKAAKTEQEKAKALNDMLGVANQFIESAEQLYKEVDAVLKAQNASAGAVKKESVITKLQAYALQNGYEFDMEYWSEKIDEIVALTKNVNNKSA